MRLEGKTALVTGAGRNVGRAISASFAREGAGVAVVDNDRGRAEDTVAELAGIRADSGVAFLCDVSDGAQVQRLVRDVVDTFGSVDVLVNNVAISDRGKTVLDLEEEEWDRVLRVTLGSVYLCSKYVGRQMVAQGRGGVIVNIGSTSGHRGRANATAYSAAKGGVLNLTRSLASQLAPHGIRVNTVTPNKVGSPVGQDDEPADRARTNLLGRGAVPADIANAVTFMASAEADFVTASELLVDGGALYGAVMD